MINEPPADHGAQHRRGLAQDNLARFTGMLQGQRDLTTVGRPISELAPLVNAHQAVIYQMETEEEKTSTALRLCGGSA